MTSYGCNICQRKGSSNSVVVSLIFAVKVYIQFCYFAKNCAILYDNVLICSICLNF